MFLKIPRFEFKGSKAKYKNGSSNSNQQNQCWRSLASRRLSLRTYSSHWAKWTVKLSDKRLWDKYSQQHHIRQITRWAATNLFISLSTLQTTSSFFLFSPCIFTANFFAFPLTPHVLHFYYFFFLLLAALSSTHGFQNIIPHYNITLLLCYLYNSNLLQYYKSLNMI